MVDTGYEARQTHQLLQCRIISSKMSSSTEYDLIPVMTIDLFILWWHVNEWCNKNLHNYFTPGLVSFFVSLMVSSSFSISFLSLLRFLSIRIINLFTFHCQVYMLMMVTIGDIFFFFFEPCSFFSFFFVHFVLNLLSFISGSFNLIYLPMSSLRMIETILRQFFHTI